MNISYLIQILQNKITILNNGKIQAFLNGDIELVNSIEKELLDTQNTFAQLTMLQEMTLAAEAANKTPAELVSDALDVIQNAPPNIQGPSASAIINGYDISPYATDPLHEQKIQNIINGMPAMFSVVDIDSYIQNFATGSPVTGEMVLKAVAQYAVDLYLLLAIMQNDSSFGLLGVGARTNNPGNVGNTGYEERMYPSWEDGVLAVGEWLNRHRIGVAPIVPMDVPVVPTEEVPVIEPEVAPEEETPEVIEEPTVEIVEPEVVPEEPAVIIEEAPVIIEESPVSVPEENVTTPNSPVSAVKKKAKRKFV